MAKIGEARFDERGKTSYGEPGDQTGQEVMISDFYINESKPWTKVFRAKSETTRQKIADAMKQACLNDAIGYAQRGDGSTVYRDRYGLYYALKQGKTMQGVTISCNCDCSSLVAQCVIAAGINVSIYMYTANEESVLMNTGEFDELEFVRGMTLVTGDIMWRQGHTGVIVEGDTTWDDEPQWVAAANAYCNVYNSNSTSSGLLKAWPHLGKGNLVDVCDSDANFYYVRIAGKYFGFVERKYLGDPPTPQFDKFIGKVTTNLYTRTGPGKGYAYSYFDRNDGKGLRCILRQNELVEVVGEENGWYHLNIQGKDQVYTPWSSSSYIIKVEDEPKIGDKVILTTDTLHTTGKGLQGTIRKIEDDKYLLYLSDGCIGYANKDDVGIS